MLDATPEVSAASLPAFPPPRRSVPPCSLRATPRPRHPRRAHRRGAAGRRARARAAGGYACALTSAGDGCARLRVAPGALLRSAVRGGVGEVGDGRRVPPAGARAPGWFEEDPSTAPASRGSSACRRHLRFQPFIFAPPAPRSPRCECQPFIFAPPALRSRPAGWAVVAVRRPEMHIGGLSVPVSERRR